MSAKIHITLVDKILQSRSRFWRTQMYHVAFPESAGTTTVNDDASTTTTALNFKAINAQTHERDHVSPPIAASLISLEAFHLSLNPLCTGWSLQKKTDLVEGRNNMLRRKTHESCIKHF